MVVTWEKGIFIFMLLGYTIVGGYPLVVFRSIDTGKKTRDIITTFHVKNLNKA